MVYTLLHTGDGHIDNSTHSTTNPKTGMPLAWESHFRALVSCVDIAIEREVSVFLHAGDAFAHGRPSQEAVLLFVDALTPLIAAGIKIVLLGGNHELLQVPSSQRTATVTVGEMLSGRGGDVHVVEREPELLRFADGFQVACLPWLSKSSILSRLGQERVDPVAGDQVVVQYALDALERMCSEADDTGPLIMASHVTVDDVRLNNVAEGQSRGSEMDMASLFAEPILPRKAVEKSPVSYAALSHIHTPQRIGTKCYYAGSPDKFTLTDAADVKSASVVTISDTNELLNVERVPTNARAMHSISLASDDAEERLAALETGALVGLVLPPGVSTVPDEIKESVVDVGASIIDTKITPVDRPRQTRVTLPERIDPVTALGTWLTEKKPDLDHPVLVDAARGLVEEVNA